MDGTTDIIYEVFHDLGSMQTLLPSEMLENMNRYDAALDKLFKAIIEAGITSFSIACNYDSTMIATNYLKREKNYYSIIKDHWAYLMAAINATFT